jgi:MFS family permease
MAEARDETPPLGTRSDAADWQPIHTRITLALGLGWMLDALEVTIIGSVLGALQKLWHLSGEQASLTVSVWLVGIMIGALLFGYFADRFGRRRLFLLTLLVYAFFTVASALSPGYTAFLVFRLLTAIGVGAEYSAVNAAIMELIPARRRGQAGAIVMNFWPLGAILAGLISLYFVNALPPSIGWRAAFACGAVVALFSIWARKALPESPRWLAVRAQHPSPAGAAGFFRQLQDLARREPGRLALGCALDFSEAAGYYGLFAVLPIIVLPRLHIADETVPWFFIIGNVGAAAGGIIAAMTLDRVGRKPMVTALYVSAALSVAVLGAAAAHGSATGVLLAFTLANLCASGSWIAAYPTFSELFPTRRRATGIGASVAFGRIGAAAAPPVLVALAEAGSLATAFAALAACWLIGVVAMIAWSLWGVEGRGQPLEVLSGD